MHELVSGPLVWVAFLVFGVGCAVKLLRLFRCVGDKNVVLSCLTWRHSLRSLAHWLVPFATTNMRAHPFMTVATFTFHLCLLATPLLLMAHGVLWYESWGIRPPSLPGGVSDAMTAAVVVCGLFFLARRVFLPVVGYVTTAGDHLVLLIAIGPFLTGLFASRGWFQYDTVLTLHIVSGALWLMAIPFTRLSHMLYFAFTRAYMGCEFGAIRNSKDW